MPVNALKGMVKKSKTGKNLKDLEKYWRGGKKSAEKAGLSGTSKYKYAMAIVKKRSSYSESAWNLFTENEWLDFLEGLDTLNEKEKQLIEAKWVAKVKTKWHPAEGFFSKSAEEIASGLKSASSGLKQAMARLNFYINRAGKDLKDKGKFQTAKTLLHKKYGVKEAWFPTPLADIVASDPNRETYVGYHRRNDAAINNPRIVKWGSPAHFELNADPDWILFAHAKRRTLANIHGEQFIEESKLFEELEFSKQANVYAAKILNRMMYDYSFDGAYSFDDAFRKIVPQNKSEITSKFRKEIKNILKIKNDYMNEEVGLKGLAIAPPQFEEPLIMAINFAKDVPGQGAHGKTYHNIKNVDFFSWLDNEVLPQMGYPTVIQLSNGTKIHIFYSDFEHNKGWMKAVSIQVVLNEAINSTRITKIAGVTEDLNWQYIDDSLFLHNFKKDMNPTKIGIAIAEHLKKKGFDAKNIKYVKITNKIPSSDKIIKTNLEKTILKALKEA